MLKRLLVILTALFSTLACLPQAEPAFPVLTGSDLPGADFLKTRTFNGEALYGYINGGADLYNEYGFKSAAVTELMLNKSKYKVEIFRMKDPVAAFGIFSVSRFKCRSRPAFAELTCLNRYQLQFCRGDYYISIINEAGTNTDSVNSVRIGTLISGKISNPAADMQWFIPEADPDAIKQNAILAKGKLGLMNGATAFESYFRDAYGYTVLVLPQKEKTLLSVRFENAEDFKLFMDQHGWGTCDLSVNDLKMRTGETLRLLYEFHLLIGIAN